MISFAYSGIPHSFTCFTEGSGPGFMLLISNLLPYYTILRTDHIRLDQIGNLKLSSTFMSVS